MTDIKARITAFLKERDEACGTTEADDAERDESANLIMALFNPALSPEAPAREPEGGAAWGAAIEAAAKAVERQIPDAAGGPMSHTNTARVFLFDAVKAIRALTPRHEAPASHAFEASHSVHREGGCKVCGHDEASHEAPAEGWSCPANHDDYARMGHGACPYCRASLEGIRAAFIAPAEGAGEREAIARIMDPKGWETRDRQYDAIKRSTMHDKDRPLAFANADYYTRDSLTKADAIIALRARSSAPEPREGETLAYGAEHQPWCQPGDQTHRAFRLRFEDPDMREMVWTGPDAEREALAAYNQYAPAWNVYLFSGHPRAAPSAEKLLDALRDQYWDLRCFNIPTGGDDFDIGWRVIGHWQAEPRERTIAEVFTDDPAEAVRQALAAMKAENRPCA